MSLKFKLVENLVPVCRIYSNAVFGTNRYINDMGLTIQGNFLSLETHYGYDGGTGGPWDRVVLDTADYTWRTGTPLKSPLEEGRWYTLRNGL